MLCRLVDVEGGQREAAALAGRLISAVRVGDRARRRRTTQVLAALAPEALDVLIAALEEPSTARAGAEALGASRDRRAVPALLRVLEDGEEDARVAAGACPGADTRSAGR